MSLTATAPLLTHHIRGRPHRPALAAGAALGVCVVVNLIDPNQQGSLGICPFKWVTGGLDCPGCGTLRATRALTRGDLLLAADHNVLTIMLLPLLLWGLVAWWRFERGTRPLRAQIPAALGAAVAIVIPVWWVGRNLPALEWFFSTAS
jgi:hypothetical protein